MRIQVLGPITIKASSGDEPSLSASLRQLLAVLIAAGERGMLQDSIAEELWGDHLPSTWESALRNGITRLRNKLGKDALLATSGRYHLNSDVVQIDAWDLIRDAAQTNPEGKLSSCLEGVPFIGVEISPTIRVMIERLQVARASVIEASARDQRPALDSADLAVLRAHQRQNPVDDWLLELTVRAHLKSGEMARALSIVNEARTEAQADDRLISSRLIALEETIRRRSAPGPLLAHANFGANAAPSLIPAALQPALDVAQVGRRSELHQVLASVATRTPVVVFGPSGTGKTRLLAAAAEQIAATGHHIRYVADGVSSAYGAILEAVPEAAAQVNEILKSTADQTVAQTKCNAALLNELNERSTGRTCLLVDDGHLLDSQSEGFLLFAATQSTLPVSVVVAARSDWEAPGWADFHRRLSDLGARRVDINPLGRREIFELATRCHPDAGSKIVMRLAEDVLRSTGGLPGVALHFIERADPETLLIDAGELGDSNPLRHYVTGLGDQATAFGVGAAVLGNRFELTDVARLLDVTVADARLGAEELVDAAFVVMSTPPDGMAFAHALYRDALLSQAGVGTLRRLHQRAASLTEDTKRQAYHLAAAVPLVSEAEATDALIEASKIYFAEGSWREAASSLREAQRRLEAPLGLDDLCRFSAALDLSGANGSLVREQAFGICVEHADWSKALEVALSGSQSAERVHGDPRRVALLEAIPSDALQDRERFRLASALVRQLAFLNRNDDAKTWADIAAECVDTPDERLMSFVHSIYVGDVSDRLEPLTVPFDFNAVEDNVTKLRGLQMSVLSHLERSSVALANPLVEQMQRLTDVTDDPYRTWHQAILNDGLAFSNGEISEACESAERTYLLGDRYGIGDAEGAYLAFGFFWRQTMNEMQLLRPEIARFRNAGSSLVHRLMTSIIANASSQVSPEDVAGFEAMVKFTASSESIFAVPSLVLAADVIARSTEPTLRDAVYNRLLSRSGTSALVANGVIHAGPVDRALAQLCARETQAEWHRRRAVEVADEQDRLLWRVRCRLERSAAWGDCHFDGAWQLAEGSELISLFDGTPVP